MTQTAGDNAAGHNSGSHGPNWIDAWLETQRGWLGRWQATTLEQRTDALRHGMETWRRQFSAAELSGEALNVVQSFQTLLQASLTQLGLLAGATGAPATADSWQQLFTGMPLGYAREQQLAWQDYLNAQSDFQRQLQALLQAFATVFAQSLEAVPAAVQQRAHAGQAVQGLRELYELWIECGERVFADVTQDERFIAIQAASANALSRMKLAEQALLEHWLKSFDLPTRSELNSVHQRLRTLSTRVAELEQQLLAAQPAVKPTAPRRSKKPS